MTEEQFKQLNTELKLHRIYLIAIASKLQIPTEELISITDEHIAKWKQNSSAEIKPQTEVVSEYPSVDDAPEWKIAFKVNTSEGISTQKVIQKAWTEKQAVFLGRTEQLFNMMNELVKAKQIQPKWSIAESSAEKIIQ
jgi:hypothetical protein